MICAVSYFTDDSSHRINSLLFISWFQLHFRCGFCVLGFERWSVQILNEMGCPLWCNLYKLNKTFFLWLSVIDLIWSASLSHSFLAKCNEYEMAEQGIRTFWIINVVIIKHYDKCPKFISAAQNYDSNKSQWT